MPVFVTSDSMLFAIHKFYDNYLMLIENMCMMNEFMCLCDSLLQSLYQVTPTDQNRNVLNGLELLFAVPYAILSEYNVLTKYCRQCDLDDMLGRIHSLSDIEMNVGTITIKLNGTMMKPRGHYTKSEELQKYFSGKYLVIMRDTKASKIETGSAYGENLKKLMEI